MKLYRSKIREYRARKIVAVEETLDAEHPDYAPGAVVPCVKVTYDTGQTMTRPASMMKGDPRYLIGQVEYVPVRGGAHAVRMLPASDFDEEFELVEEEKKP